MRQQTHSKTIHFSAQKQLKSSQKIFMREMFRSEDGFSSLLKASVKKNYSNDSEDLDTYKRLHMYFVNPAHQILRFLDRWEQYPDEDEVLTQYFMMMSLLQERVHSLLRTLNISQENLHRHFKSFEMVRCWANFVKYPKAFMYVPFPDYYMEENKSMVMNQMGSNDLIIDSNFILKYYAQDELVPNDALTRRLNYSETVWVEVPDLVLLTSQMTKALHKLMDILSSDDRCMETLEEKKFFTNV